MYPNLILQHCRPAPQFAPATSRPSIAASQRSFRVVAVLAWVSLATDLPTFGAKQANFLDMLPAEGAVAGFIHEEPENQAAEALPTQGGCDDTPPPVTDAISRELTVYNDRENPVEIEDAVSREVTVYNDTDGVLEVGDAVSRELTVFNDRDNPVTISDAVSRELTTFTAIPLQLGTPHSGTLTVGGPLYFRLTVPANLTVRITLHHLSPTAWTQLFAAFDQLPDDNAEFASDTPAQPDQELIIPNTQAGTYYILARATNETNPPQSGAFSIVAAGVPFGVDGVEPQIVGAGAEVTLRVTGGHLNAAADIRLLPSAGGSYISAVQLNVINAARARPRFNLSGAPLGTYDIVAVSQSGPVVVLATAVTVESPDETAVDLEVIPAAGMQRVHGAIQGITKFILRNNTNVDVPFVRLDVFAPADPNLSVYLDGEAPEPFTTMEEYEEGRFLISSLAPGEEVSVPILIDLHRGYQKDSIVLFPTVMALSRNQMLEGVLFRAGGWFEQYVNLLRQEASWTPEAEAQVPHFKSAVREAFLLYGFDGPDGLRRSGLTPPTTNTWCRVPCLLPPTACLFCIGPHGLPCGIICGIVAGTAALFCDNAAGDWCPECPQGQFCETEIDCGTCAGGTQATCCVRLCTWQRVTVQPGDVLQCKRVCEDGVWVPYNCSADPNEKAGPSSYGGGDFIKSDMPITYRIYFENLPSATAPAAEVIITDMLDSPLNTGSFRIRKFNFGTNVINVPGERASFETTIDLTSEIGLLVHFQGGVDPLSRSAEFTLRALDPATMQLPMELDRGFLPPNDDTGRGEGFVEFTILPRADVDTGMITTNGASIVFDFNNPIITNRVVNTIDAGAPLSSIAALPQASLTPLYISWTGEDDAGGCGVAKYDVYVSTNGSDYRIWNSDTGTNGVFDGQVGSTYSFFTVGSDYVGNVEQAPVAPDATTTILGCGDVNLDSQLSLLDWGFLRTCVTGPRMPLGVPCSTADSDVDGDVDLLNFAAFQVAFGGSGGQGDFDGDGDVDLDDFVALLACQTVPLTAFSSECLSADLDNDVDGDLADFASFQACYEAGVQAGIGQ